MQIHTIDLLIKKMPKKVILQTKRAESNEIFIAVKNIKRLLNPDLIDQWLWNIFFMYDYFDAPQI